VIACGSPLYTHPDIPVYDHTVTKKLLHASAGHCDIVWIDNNRLACYEPLDKEVLSRCVTDEKIPKHITQAWGEFKTSDKPLWQRSCEGSLALAVARNAVVIADSARIVAVELSSGKRLWSQKLPSAPVPWGMAIDRAGRVILTLVDGRVVSFGEQRRTVALETAESGL
jgi:hypothetical protein